MNRIASTVTGLLLLALSASSALAQSEAWPRTLTLDEGTVTVYQPQIEALDDGVLYYRAALAYRPQADAEPIFGAGWLKAPVDIDESKGFVHPSRLELTQTRFPDGTADMQAEIATALLKQSPDWNLDFSVAELEAALDDAEAESLAAQKLKTAPPKIIYRNRPALLVTIDGEPVLREIENSPYQAVINTPFPLITDGDDYYLNAAKDVWYRAGAATGPYRFDASPPQDIKQMVEDTEAKAAVQTSAEDVAEREPVTAANAPEIVVSTEPAELIVTEGPADFVPLIDDLLVLHNSDDDVFLHVGEQKYYIVLAGRWYRSSALEGPWEYQASDQLPSAFARIPDDSAQADSRVYVAGTPEAEVAVLDAQVPQTAAVKRGEVDIDVEYDGDPEFDRVEGTEDLRYARNTGATVLESDRTYYLLEDGVWYVASSPNGPWVVSDHRPGEIDSIEPSSPVYNTKYVYVYDSTPEVVYVGYTPGYLGSYVYHNTIVYGTGWRYRPWVSPYYYYPRFHTYGFHVGYSDWGGWNFGLSWYWPYYSLNYHYGGYWHYGHPWYNRYWGYWGPRGYAYRPYYRGYNHYNRYGYKHHDNGHYKGYGKGSRYYDRHDKYAYGDDNRWDQNYDRGERYDRERNRNLYRDDGQRARVARTRDAWRNDRGPDRDRVAETPRRDPGSEQRLVDNRKVQQSNAGPVRPTDLRRKADARDININRDDSTVAPRRDQDTVAQRDAGNRVAQRTAPQRKVGESRTEPVAQSDLRARATARNEKMRESRTEPVAQRDAGNRVTQRTAQQRKVGESRTEPVSQSDLRARATARNEKIRENRTTPITREDLRQRGDFATMRNDNEKPSVNRPLPEPSRSVDRSNRQASSQPREVASRAPDNQPSRQVTSPPRQVDQRAPQTRPSRQVSSPPRQVEQRAPQTRPSRQIASPPRQVEQRAPQTQPNRREPAPMRQESRAPVRQMSREPSPPQRAASTPRPEQRSAPRPEQRSAPRPQQRSAPRQQQRSAPPPKAERSAPNRESRDFRERRRKN